VADESSKLRTRPLTRRRFLAALGGAGLTALAGEAFLLEPYRVTATRHRIGAQQGPASRRLTLVQLTDLHLRRIGHHEQHIARMVNDLKPHVVVFTGDIINDMGGLDLLGRFLRLLDPQLPKYAVYGNWEHKGEVSVPQLAEVYRQGNGRLLVNETVVHRHGDVACLITGVDDLVAGHPDINRALAGVEPLKNHLLLAHCPAYRDQLASSRETGLSAENRERFAVEFMLAGHTHGGQVTFFGYAPYLPSGCGRYLRGWYEDALPRLYVSRGLGTTSLPVRFMAPPEIACFHWHLAAG
jgi:predicted MPP superfamily phosphohydrolase